MQNCNVPIKTRISWARVRWPDGYTDLNWKENYAKAHARWLAGYTLWIDPNRLDENRYYRCPHGCLVATDTEDGREANYCTVCRPLSVSTPPRLKPYPLPPALRGKGFYVFPRDGVFYLTLRGTIGRHYYPGDHEICPYEPRQRMRTPEAPGGYRRSGRKDGVGILAFPKRAIYDEGDEPEGELEGPPGSFAALLRPWEFERKDKHLFLRRWFNPIIVPVLEHDTSPLEFAIAPAHRVRWSDLHEGEEPTIKYDDFKRGPNDGRVPEWKTSPWSISVPEESCTDEDIERWRKKYWQTRTPYVQRSRKPWAEGWRTERKMRDLDALLNLYQWGSHNELRNVPQMLAGTRQRYLDAREKEETHCGVNVRQQPPRHKTERRYLYTAPGAPPMMCYDGNYKAPAIFSGSLVRAGRSSTPQELKAWIDNLARKVAAYSAAQLTTQIVPNHPEIPRLLDFPVDLTP